MGEYINIAYLRELSGNDDTFLKSVANELRLQIDHLLNSFPKFAAEKEYCEIKRSAHKFRSVLLYLGNPTLANKLKVIEEKAVEGSEGLGEEINSFCDTLKKVKAELDNEF